MELSDHHVNLLLRLTDIICDVSCMHFIAGGILDDEFGSAVVTCNACMKDPEPLVKKSRVLWPGGRFLPSFIHQLSSSPAE